MKILITGGAGFIGKHLTKYLLENDESVTIFDNFSNSIKKSLIPFINLGVKVIEGDITELSDIQNAVKDQDIVIHLAAKISVSESMKNPLETFQVNVEGTRNVLTACEKNNIKKLIILSSDAVYGNNDNFNKKFKENEHLQPISPYGKSKLEMEKITEKFSHEFSLNTIVFRLFNVYGKGQTDEYAGVISKFANCIKKKMPLIIYGDGSQTRDFVAIEDVVNIISKQIKSKVKNTFEIFNIGNDESTTIINLANLMIRISGEKNKINFHEVKEGEIKHSRAAIEKAKNQLNYIPTISLCEGITKFLRL